MCGETLSKIPLGGEPVNGYGYFTPTWRLVKASAIPFLPLKKAQVNPPFLSNHQLDHSLIRSLDNLCSSILSQSSGQRINKSSIL
jgi:hypothetical protein